MPSRPIRSSISLAACAVPAALVAALAAWSAVVGGLAAGETGYLAVIAAGVLAAAAGLSPRAELWLGAPLVALAAWALPAGPARGAVVTALAAAVLAVAGGRRLSGWLASETEGAVAGGSAPEAGGGDAVALSGRAAAAFTVFLPLAFGVQLLCRGERLLAPSSAGAIVAGLVALPVAAAAALAVLAARHGPRPAAVAGAATAVLAPGFNVVATLALVALAAGGLLVELRGSGRESGGRWPRRTAGVFAAAALAALVALAAPFAWEPRSAAVALAGAAVATGWPAAVGLGGVLALGLAVAAPLTGWRAAVAAVAWVPILLPTLPWALVAGATARRGSGTGWRRAAAVAAGLALAVAAARAVPGPAALAAPVALLALLAIVADPARAVATAPARSQAGLVGAQGAWSAALLAGTALLAAYPWLRREAAVAALDLLGLRPKWSAALVLAVAIPLAALAPLAPAVVNRLRSRAPGTTGARPGAAGPGAAAACTLALVVAALAFALPRDQRTVVARENALDAAHPRFAVVLSGGPVTAVRVESTLANAADLMRGARVATVALVGGDGRRVEWVLTSGRDTGEWAARRPDVAAVAGLTVPPAWISWVAVAEGRTFFAQRYLRRFETAVPLAAVALEVVRDPGLPAPVRIDLDRLEVER